MDQPQPFASPEDREATEALRDARTRFVDGFSPRFSAMVSLVDSIGGSAEAVIPLLEAAHKLAGLAGMLGFPTVSDHASAVEQALLAPSIDVAEVRAAMARMGDGFTGDLAGTAPSWAQEAAPVVSGTRILLVEDDQEQRRIAAAGLRAAGYRVVTAESVAEAVEVARTEHPDLILVDDDLPTLDGMAVCRQIKLTSALAAIPVILCTARSGMIDRMADLTLGASDYLTKPYAPNDLLMRIKRLVSRAAPAPAVAPPVSGLLSYDQFAVNAREVLASGPAALVLVRVASADLERLAGRCLDEVRRRDILGRVSATHLVMLAPELSASAARSAMLAIVGREPAFEDAATGAAETGAAGADTLDALLEAADLALAADRVARSGGQAGRTTVLLAEDDPDVLHIIDARLRAAGYHTVLALDGEQTLEAIEREHPAVMLLDLMMPKLTGFDVLMRLRERPGARPQIIVVSARGRDKDVERAFELGADDYVTKPFNPEELMARIARLIR